MKEIKCTIINVSVRTVVISFYYASTSHILTMNNPLDWSHSLDLQFLFLLCKTFISTFWILLFHTGARFTSPLWTSLSPTKVLLHLVTCTTAFHPPSNGKIERVRWRLTSSLTARCASSEWVWLLLFCKSTPHDLSGRSPAVAVFGSILPPKQSCGSGMFIPDPNFSIPDPHQRI